MSRPGSQGSDGRSLITLTAVSALFPVLTTLLLLLGGLLALLLLILIAGVVLLTAIFAVVVRQWHVLHRKTPSREAYAVSLAAHVQGTIDQVKRQMGF